jgi:triacylglycerol esterase/lipase EstA (alpha/beta hydrolase family)
VPRVRALAAIGVALGALLCAAGCGCGGHVGDDPDAAGGPADAMTDAGGPAQTDAAAPPDPIRPVPGDVIPGGGPYPFVLCHGMGGFDALGPLEYFYGVADHLTDLGYEVYTTEVPQFDSVAARAAALAPQIDAILAASGADKVNLIGHSQGGLDIRYLVSSLGYGSVVASITTVGTPHYGTPVADLVMGILPASTTEVLDALLALFGPVLGQSPEADLMAGLADLTTVNMTTAFNPANPDDPGVAYYSVGGVCTLPPFTPYTPGVDDLCDIEVQATYLFLLDAAGANDGLLPETSAHWGTYLGVIPADHLDEVGQIAGITSLAFDHLAFYANLAAFLRMEGF